MKTIRIALLCFLSLISFSSTRAQSTSSFGRNIIAVSPIQVMAFNHFDSNNGADVGMNISYERISSNEYFGFKLPISFSLKNPYYYFMPALKIYPFKQGVAKFSFGPQFYFAAGQVEYELNSYNYPNQPYKTLMKDRTQIGFLINTSANFTILENFYLGLEAGLGLNYYDDNAGDTDLYDENDYYYSRKQSEFYPALQLNFSMGYRF